MIKVLKALIVAYAELANMFQKNPMNCKAYRDAMDALR